MRERGFLEEKEITAKSIIHRKKQLNQLITVEQNELLINVFNLMKEKGLTQLPVTNEGAIEGSISERNILNFIIESGNIKESKVGEIMSKPFPTVEWNMNTSELSKLITKENAAVLVKKPSGEFGIITEFDLIEALA
jgi:cystathionine beta-synthase